MAALPRDGEVIVAEGTLPGSEVCDVYVGSSVAGRTLLCRARVKSEDERYFFPSHLAEHKNDCCPVMAQTVDGHLICDVRGIDDIMGNAQELAMLIIETMSNLKVNKVRVIWCVDQIDRLSEQLTKQAKFIAGLMLDEADRAQRTAFWRDSVALVLKGMDCEGRLGEIDERLAPLRLAVENGGSEGIGIRRNFQIFEILTDEYKKSFRSEKDEVRLEFWGVVRRDELSDFQNEYILNELKPFKIFRTNDRCVKNGFTGDRRLFKSMIMTGVIRPSSRVCDVYVGTCGAGKTTLCRARAQMEDKHYFIPEDSARIGTRCPVIAQTVDGHLICDTRGFDDAEVTDEQTATQIIQAIFDQRVEKVRVIWCVKEYDRPSDHITQQAKFIASLMPEGADRVAFWRDSVALVLKGMDLAGQLEDEAERVAPVKLAVKNGGSEGIQIRRNIQIFEKLSVRQQKLYAMQSKQDRQDDYGVVKLDELSDFQNECIVSKLEPFKISRTNDRCVKCGLTGDRRLWQPGCHAVFHHAHPGVYQGNETAKECAEAIERGAVKLCTPLTVHSELVISTPLVVAPLTVYGVAKSAEYLTRCWECCEQSASDAQGCCLRCSVCEAWKSERPVSPECTAAHQLCKCRSISADSCTCMVTIRD